MNSISQNLRALHADENGATATEYLILLTLIACFVITVVKLFGSTLERKFADANNAVNRRVTF